MLKRPVDLAGLCAFDAFCVGQGSNCGGQVLADYLVQWFRSSGEVLQGLGVVDGGVSGAFSNTGRCSS